MSKKNPFNNSNFIKPKNYSKSKTNLESFKKLINENSNINLYGENGIGKTTLVKIVFYQLEKEKKAKTFFIDISATENITDFYICFINSIINQLDIDHADEIKSKFAAKLNSESAFLFSNNLTNLKEAAFYFEEILKYVQDNFTKVIIAIDDIQQAKKYPEKNSLSSIKLVLERFLKFQFIFISSSDVSKYLKTKSLQRTKIDAEDYKKFIKKKLKKGKIKCDESVLEKIISITNGKPIYVQLIFSRIFDMDLKIINEEIFDQVVEKILNENEILFLTIQNLLTPYQFKTLKAIAKQKAAMQLTSHSFIEANNLNAPSSVKTALNSLLKKEIIIKENKNYRISNVFFSLWLAKL